MVRPLRVEYNDAFFHVMNRGKPRQFIFHDTAYYQAFIKCLEQAQQRFATEIHAYCLMGNHYHLLIKTPKGNLSRAMHHINGVYTQKYNVLKKTDGPLFRGRYKAILIEASSYLLEVSRYIHRNPVELKRPLVNKLIDYKWSSYPAYLNKRDKPSWLMVEDIYGELSVLHPIPAYQRFVEKGLDEDTRNFYARNVWPAIRGDKSFVEFAYGNVFSQDREVAGNRNREDIPIKAIIKTVASYYGVKEQQITQAKRGRGGKIIRVG
jgi:putative transposase